MAASLTVVIITLNEESNIVECIKSTLGADEVIVVDAGSRDRTAELATSHGARVVEHPMTDFAQQRNYANSIAKSDWIFHLDADERLTPALRDELKSALSSNTYSGYRVPRLNFIFGAPLHHGGWYPQYEMRLQRRGRGMWSRAVHETAALREGSVGTLREPYEHRGHPDVRTFLAKTDRYTSIEAEALAGRSMLTLGLLAVVVPPIYFAYKYVFQAGFRDGWRGFAAATLLSFYRALAYVKAMEVRSSRSSTKS